ncbi:glycosyltransferase family 2 protein [Alteromonas sediminis]|uniref:Glycosyltransferase family 2 protein n=1 Tax=Alteromonas sediminis TaxID=2259342 RepID=A0A3N5XXX0_9ALTE|nr:glycosyltransferase family 2 protein [Alteromonas sediminis]RPJ65712.1 glycosyltransferase family 2 protein [Alteromonas sediminis]
MKDAPRILLAGIAKNEGAYLPEWVFFHLNLGVKGIVVYVNNTDDNSTKVLDKLGEQYPVKYKVVDGIDGNDDERLLNMIGDDFRMRAALHSKSYADIYLNTDPEEYDYILFLDIDEFLCLDKSIESLAKTEIFEFPVIHFQWFAASGDDVPFSLLDKQLKGEMDQFTKYMVKTGSPDMKLYSSHIARLSCGRFKVSDSGVIIHRVLRSKKEYLALIARSNPSNSNLANGFKLNRRGWTNKGSKNLPARFSYLFENYETRFKGFCHSCGIEQEIETARANVLDRAAAVERNIEALNLQNEQLGRVLAGTGLKHFSFLKWLKSELKERTIRALFHSLVLQHIPIMSQIKFKLGIYKKDKFLD